MHDRLVQLLALDRLVELIGADRIRAMADRQLPLLALLDALDGRRTLDADAVRALAAALPATATPATAAMPPAPVTADPAQPAAVGGGITAYFEAARALIGDVPESQPMSSDRGQTTQIYVGPNVLVLARPRPGAALGADLGRCFVSQTTAAGGGAWRERFVVADPTDWLEGRLDIKRTADAWDTLEGSEERARKERDVYAATVAQGSTVTLDFQYTDPPTATQRQALLDAAVKVSGVERRLFEVIARTPSAAGPTTLQGWLYRERFTTSSRDVVLDQWRLRHDYRFPTATSPLGFVRVTEPATLAAFFARVDDYEAAQGTGPKGWYVQTAYQMQPL